MQFHPGSCHLADTSIPTYTTYNRYANLRILTQSKRSHFGGEISPLKLFRLLLSRTPQIRARGRVTEMTAADRNSIGGQKSLTECNSSVKLSSIGRRRGLVATVNDNDNTAVDFVLT